MLVLTQLEDDDFDAKILGLTRRAGEQRLTFGVAAADYTLDEVKKLPM